MQDSFEVIDNKVFRTFTTKSGSVVRTFHSLFYKLDVVQDGDQLNISLMNWKNEPVEQTRIVTVDVGDNSAEVTLTDGVGVMSIESLSEGTYDVVINSENCEPAFLTIEV